MACEIEATVRVYDPSGQETGQADSIRGALGTQNLSNPASVFALRAESTLIAALERSVCREGQPIKLELSFVQIELTARADSIARFRKILLGHNNPYATVTYDQNAGVVNAMIVWNERQILRDQLSLLGWDIDGATTLAFDQEAYWKLAIEYEKKVLFAESPASSLSAREDLKGVISPDLFGLFSQKQPRLSRFNINLIVFSSFLMNRALEISQPGYSRMTEIAILRALSNPAAPPIVSVNEAIAAGFSQPYETLRWLGPTAARERLLEILTMQELLEKRK